MREMFTLHQDPARHSKSLRSAGHRVLYFWKINLHLLKELFTSSTAWEVWCHSCNIRVRHERGSGFIILPYTKEYLLQFQVNPPPNRYKLQRIQYFVGFSMQDQWNIRKICMCFCPSQAAHCKYSFLNIAPREVEHRKWSLKKILQIIVVGVE